LLIYFNDNWADEFNLGGVALMEEEEWNNAQSKIPSNQPLHYGFGSNQYLDYEDREDFLRHFWSRVVSNEEAAILRRLIKGIRTGYGFWPLNEVYAK